MLCPLIRKHLRSMARGRHPTVISQEVRFGNAGADLVGTVNLPNSGDHLPAAVVLHHAGAPTREAALYRHLREGLPALGFAVPTYDRRGSGQSSGSLPWAILILVWPSLVECRIAASRPR